MIGQEELKATIDTLLSKFPRFLILTGDEGSGRKTIARYTAARLNAEIIMVGNRVDDVREIIEIATKHKVKRIYLFENADNMSTSAKNALLKITEEPPRNAYLIMTVKNIDRMLKTIKSRATILTMDSYNIHNLEEYIKLKKYNLTAEEKEMVCRICTNPGEVDRIIEYDITAFYNYVKTVVEHIGKVHGANALKIGEKLKYKKDGEGWEIDLFFRTVITAYADLFLDRYSNTYLECMRVTSKYMSELDITGINKQMLVDAWILDIRQVCGE